MDYRIIFPPKVNPAITPLTIQTIKFAQDIDNFPVPKVYVAYNTSATTTGLVEIPFDTWVGYYAIMQQAATLQGKNIVASYDADKNVILDLILLPGFVATFQINGVAFDASNLLTPTESVFANNDSTITLLYGDPSVTCTFKIPNDGSFSIADIYNTPAGLVINSLTMDESWFYISATCSLVADTTFNWTNVVIVWDAFAQPYYDALVANGYTMSYTERKAWNNFNINLQAGGFSLGTNNDLAFLYLCFGGSAARNALECYDPASNVITWNGANILHKRGGSYLKDTAAYGASPVYAGWGDTGMNINTKIAAANNSHIGFMSGSQMYFWPSVGAFHAPFDNGSDNGGAQATASAGNAKSYMGRLGNDFITVLSAASDMSELVHVVANRPAAGQLDLYADGQFNNTNAAVNATGLPTLSQWLLDINLGAGNSGSQSGRKARAFHGGKGLSGAKVLLLWKELTVLQYYLQRSNS